MSDYTLLIRDIADFPKPGIVFKDITPLLADAGAFAQVIADMAAPWRSARIDAIAGIESRGFILGAALAQTLGAGFLPVRKPGKLPGARVGVDYELEYGQGRLEIHEDGITQGSRVLIVDDVLATGGTLAAARELIECVGASVVGASLMIELSFLDGRQRWQGDMPLHALLRY
jgi:adenine phosphoribosyltransferase